MVRTAEITSPLLPCFENQSRTLDSSHTHSLDKSYGLSLQSHGTQAMRTVCHIPAEY